MNQDLTKDIEEILFTEEQLQKRIGELGAELSRDYADKNPLVVGILKGVIPFYAAVVNRITVPMTEDFMSVSSYNGTHSTGRLVIWKDLDRDITERHILLIEDIVDSGITLFTIKHNLLDRGAASVRICTLFDKPASRKVEISADYCGFLCPDKFIVGYGLDYNEYYRNLPFVGVLKKEIYAAGGD